MDFRVNKVIQTCVQFSMGVKIQLFEVGTCRSNVIRLLSGDG
jgi:hypothetical protein